MARDNFTKPVIAQLAARADNTCSICGAVTQFPSSTAQNTSKVGIAAHICAASLGGPRYSLEMSTQQRTAYDNGIWLCAVCATLIDREPDQYPPDLLKKYKNATEAKARKLIGKRRLDNEDVTNQIKSLIFGVPVSKSLATIANAHAAVAQSLEDLDPRFSVFTSHSKNGVSVQLMARENIPFTLRIDREALPNWRSQYQALIEHGEGFKAPTRHLELKGSLLLDQIQKDIAGNNGQLIFEPLGDEIRLQWFLIDPQQEIKIDLMDLTGSVIRGTKSGTMKLAGYDGLLKVTFRVSLENGQLIPKFNITLDTGSWEGCDIRALPHLQPLKQFFEKIQKGWSIATSIIQNYQYFEIGKLTLGKQNQGIAEIAQFLEYTVAAKHLAQKLNKSIRYPRDGVVTHEEQWALENFLEWLNRSESPPQVKQSGRIFAKLIVDNPDHLVRAVENQQLQTVRSQGSFPPLNIFGQKIEVPSIEWILQPTLISTTADIKSIKQGDEIDVIYKYNENSTMSVRICRP